MVVAASKALKARFKCPLFMGVKAAYRELAKACLHVDDAFSDWEGLKSAIAPYPSETVLGFDLSYYGFSVSPRHQIDAYLAFFNIEAPPHLKNIELRADPRAEARAEEAIAAWPPLPAGKARILIHPGSGDANRTWPLARWEELASRLIAGGHQVVVVGSRSARNDRGVHELAVPGLLTAVDRLEPLATVALMRRADLLVCTDGGPVQLAGATDIAIVGIYSVVAGANRLPFRHGEPGWGAKAVSPECPAHPCIHQLSDAAIKERIDRAIRGELASPFGGWCARPDQYHCMTHEITVSMVLDACQHMLAERQAPP